MKSDGGGDRLLCSLLLLLVSDAGHSHCVQDGDRTTPSSILLCQLVQLVHLLELRAKGTTYIRYSDIKQWLAFKICQIPNLPHRQIKTPQIFSIIMPPTNSYYTPSIRLHYVFKISYRATVKYLMLA